MKFYKKYEKPLIEAGYTLDEQGQVIDALGQVCAGEDRFGQAWCKDPNINDITRNYVEPKPKPKRKVPAKPVEVEE